MTSARLRTTQIDVEAFPRRLLEAFADTLHSSFTARSMKNLKIAIASAIILAACSVPQKRDDTNQDYISTHVCLQSPEEAQKAYQHLYQTNFATATAKAISAQLQIPDSNITIRYGCGVDTYAQSQCHFDRTCGARIQIDKDLTRDDGIKIKQMLDEHLNSSLREIPR